MIFQLSIQSRVSARELPGMRPDEIDRTVRCIQDVHDWRTARLPIVAKHMREAGRICARAKKTMRGPWPLRWESRSSKAKPRWRSARDL